MIEYLILFLVIFGWTVPFSIDKQENRPYRLVASCSIIIIILFVFSVFQFLGTGIFIVTMLGVVGGLVLVKQIVLNKELRIVSLQHLIILAVIFILAFFASWGADYWAWDEFTHWGAQVEYLLLNGNLHTDSKLLLCPDYIPGMSLWRYFGRTLLKGSGVSGAYFINFVLMFSCVFAVSHSKSTSKWLSTAFIVFLGLLVFFQGLVPSLYVDPVQSLLLLCALKMISEDNQADFVCLLLVSAIVVLTKHVGLIFVLLIVCYYMVLNLFAYKKASSIVLKKTGIILVPSLLCYIVWSVYVNYVVGDRAILDSSVFLTGNIGDSLGRLWANFLGVLDSRFPHAALIKPTISDKTLSHGVSLWVFTFAVLVFGFILACLPSQKRKENAINFLFLLTSCFFYLLFLAFVRATTSMGGDPYSFSRYFCVVLFSCFFLQILTTLNDSVIRIVCTGLIITALYLIVAPRLDIVISLKKRQQPFINVEYREKAQIVKKYAHTDDFVWYINTENIMAYFIFRMKMLPLPVLDYMKGSGVYLDNVLLKQEDVESRVALFSKNLCDTDFIFIDEVSPVFWTQYSGLFDKLNGRLYKVKKVDEKRCYAMFLE